MTHRALLAAIGAAMLLTGAAHAEDLRIGASLPLTGNFSVAGQKHQQGYEHCVSLINEKGGILGRQVELIVSDNRSDPATAINQIEMWQASTFDPETIDKELGWAASIGWLIASVMRVESADLVLSVGDPMESHSATIK